MSVLIWWCHPDPLTHSYRLSRWILMDQWTLQQLTCRCMGSLVLILRWKYLSVHSTCSCSGIHVLECLNNLGSVSNQTAWNEGFNAKIQRVPPDFLIDSRVFVLASYVDPVFLEADQGEDFLNLRHFCGPRIRWLDLCIHAMKHGMVECGGMWWNGGCYPHFFGGDLIDLEKIPVTSLQGHRSPQPLMVLLDEENHPSAF